VIVANYGQCSSARTLALKERKKAKGAMEGGVVQEKKKQRSRGNFIFSYILWEVLNLWGCRCRSPSSIPKVNLGLAQYNLTFHMGSNCGTMRKLFCRMQTFSLLKWLNPRHQNEKHALATIPCSSC